MDNIQYIVQARGKIKDILTLSIAKKWKIMLLESVKKQLQISAKLSEASFQTNLTKFDGTTDLTFMNEKDEIETLIEKILFKQRVKFQNDTQIDNLQDDLLQLSKVIETKRDYTQELKQKIIKQQLERQQKENNSFSLSRIRSSPSILLKLFG